MYVCRMVGIVIEKTNTRIKKTVYLKLWKKIVTVMRNWRNSASL